MTKAVTREDVIRIAHAYGLASIRYGKLEDDGYSDQVAAREALELAITEIIRERDEAVAILTEENSLLDACGTILCRHQIKHNRFDGCLYCDRDKWKDKAITIEPIEEN